MGFAKIFYRSTEGISLRILNATHQFYVIYSYFMGNKIEVDCLHAHLNIEQMDHKHGYIFAEQQFLKQQQKCRTIQNSHFTERQKFYLVNINFRLYSKNV